MTEIHNLAEKIQAVNTAFRQQAYHSINTLLTVRNWLIGYHIVVHEQENKSRAGYGEELLKKLADSFKKQKIEGLSYTNLNLYRQFYIVYPGIIQTLPEYLRDMPILQTLSEELTAALEKAAVKEISTGSSGIRGIDEVTLLNRLSFSHFVELIKIDDPVKRSFYEMETVRGTLSVRELKRQVNTLTYERTAVSADKNGLLKRKHSVSGSPVDLIKNSYIFEFLGVPLNLLEEESALEKALIDNIEQFLLELGIGFCFEARQKRILIGNEYFFIDLVFYHRILKRHVLIELKTTEFRHEYAGQLNAYINYYNDMEKQGDDNEAIGLLLCTGGNQPLVEYAITGMDKNMFVRKYMINLPDTGDIIRLIEETTKEINSYE